MLNYVSFQVVSNTSGWLIYWCYKILFITTYYFI